MPVDLLIVYPEREYVLTYVVSHDALAIETNAAAIASAIALTITIDSPWSVEEGLQRPTCKSGARRAVVAFRPELADGELARPATRLAGILSPGRVIHA